ncbi:succinylglutamate desuccinylase/aspartoacylase family protein [Hydrogenophaga sp. 2FB]|uniref:succinylglutamate desuccinylase/aspartoacylase family protein n=1 Tax=Hydrogenophaga sp. 2FB TaxID=2502187 RepID=UPI0010F6BBF0|nr:succinylglutamate desuccinylase/aspartoacylase family protein [Hydrogenophaga sp. 2FB]
MAQLFSTAGQGMTSEVDFDAEGKQCGYLRLPHSVHRSAYGWIPVPVASIRNGPGPVVLVMGGNHGDEYEGQLIVSRLIREIDPSRVQGQLILLPMANLPAAKAGLRTSPIDGGNLNRLFPGNPAGSITEVLGSYIEQALLTRADLLLDLHSGGSSLVYHGSLAMAGAASDEEEDARLRPLLRALGARYTCLLKQLNPRTILGAARRQNCMGLVLEIGGGGQVSRPDLEESWHGVRRTLIASGVLHGEPAAPASAGHWVDLAFGADSCNVFARSAGLFEPLVGLGDTVQAGQTAARIHDPSAPHREPELVHFEAAGTVVCQRVPALTEVGDCLFQVASISGPLQGIERIEEK